MAVSHDLTDLTQLEPGAVANANKIVGRVSQKMVTG